MWFHHLLSNGCSAVNGCRQKVGLHNILHAIVMQYLFSENGSVISVNFLQLFSNGAAFNTQGRSSLTSYAISRSLSHAMHL